MDREQIKQNFVAQRGYWREWTQTLLQENPGFVAQYATYAGYPASTGPLSARMVELIYVGLDASGSHLFGAGLQTHMQKAVEAGASTADIFDVLHLVAVQGGMCVAQAAQQLSEVFGLMPDAAATSVAPEYQAVADAHGLVLQHLAQLDPGYVHVLLDFMAHGQTGTGLSETERTLVQVALHACFTAFNGPALRQLLLTGKDQGLQPGALLQAIQLGGHLAVHGTALGATVFRQLTTAISN